MTAATSRGRVLVLALLALLAALAVPSLAAAAPRWLAPTDLTPAGERATTPKIVMGADGSSTAAWVAGGVVRVSTRPPGTAAWPAAVDVSAAGATGIVDLVTDPAGNAAVAWTTDAGAPGAVHLHAAVRPAGGAFGAAEDIPGPVAGSMFTAFAADGAGGFVAAWSGPLFGGQPSTASVSTRAPGGGWSPAETISGPGDHALVYGASGAGGRVAVVYTGAALGSTERAVKVRERIGGVWAPEGVASSDAGSVVSATVAVGPAGELLATWFTGAEAGPVVQAASRPAGGAWGPVETLGPGGGMPPKALIEPDATATVVWSGPGVVARVRPPGSGFGPLQTLSARAASLPSPFSPALGAAGPTGGVIAAWTAGESLGGVNVVRAAIKPAAGTAFEPAATISAPGAGTGTPSAAIGPGGEGVAMWLTGSDPLGTAGVVHAADHTERPGDVLQPSPVAVRIDQAPRTTTEGTMLRLKLAVDGFADGLPVRLQQKYAGAFRDMGPVVSLSSGQPAEMQLRLTFPGKLVVRLAYESQGKPAFSRSVTIFIKRPGKPLLPAGASPKQVAVGLGAVWVLTEDDAGRTVVLRLDQRTGRATADPIPVDGASRIAIGGGAVWVSRGYTSDRGIVRIDPAAAKVAAELPIISSGAIAAGPAGVWTIECVRRTGFESGCNEQHLARIDPAANTIGQRITVVAANEDFSPSASGLTVGARYVWFSVYRDKSTTTRRFDTRSGKIATDAGFADGLVAHGDAVWGFTGKCRLASGRGAGRLVSRLQVAGQPRFGCTSVALDGRSAWVVQGANTFGIDPASVRVPARLVRVDAVTGRQVGRPIALGAAPAAVDVAGGIVWAASGDEGVIRRIVPPKAGARPSAVKPYRPPRPRAAWRRPATIAGSTATIITSVDLAVGDRGRSAILWQTAERRGTPSVVSAIRRAGATSWMPARRLGRAASSFFTGTAAVEMNAAGDAVAAWTSGGGSILNSSAQAALLGAKARAWWAPTTLGDPETGFDAHVGIASDGSALAAWTCRCAAGTTEIRMATRPSGGAFGAPAPLVDVGATPISNAQLATSPGGEALAAWAPALGAGLTAAVRPPGGAFGSPVTLVAPAVIGAVAPRVAIDDAGRGVVVWMSDGVFARVRGADGTWGGTERIAPPGRYSNDGAKVAIDEAGNILVATRAFDLETFNFRVMVIARRAGALGWEKPMWVSPKGPTEGPPGASAGEPSLAMNAHGEAVVAWPQAIAGKPRVLARLRPAGRLAWRPLEAVSAREGKLAAVAAAIDASGAPTVAWAARAGASSTARQVIRTASRPALRTAK